PARPEGVLQSDAQIASHQHRLHRDRHLVAAGPKHRPLVGIAEQPVGGTLHVDHVFRMGANAAEETEHALDEEGWLDEAAIDEMGDRVEVADVIALDLESCAGLRTGSKNPLDIGKGVLEHPVARAFEIWTLPVMFELREA